MTREKTRRFGIGLKIGLLAWSITVVTVSVFVVAVIPEQMHFRTGVLALICMLLSVLGSRFYARFLVWPMQTMQAVAGRIARGDLSARAVIHTGDELELLADSFNAMAGSLLQRDTILGSVRFAGQQFLAATDWRTVADEVLSRIGPGRGD